MSDVDARDRLITLEQEVLRLRQIRQHLEQQLTEQRQRGAHASTTLAVFAEGLARLIDDRKALHATLKEVAHARLTGQQ